MCVPFRQLTWPRTLVPGNRCCDRLVPPHLSPEAGSENGCVPYTWVPMAFQRSAFGLRAYSSSWQLEDLGISLHIAGGGGGDIIRLSRSTSLTCEAWGKCHVNSFVSHLLTEEDHAGPSLNISVFVRMGFDPCYSDGGTWTTGLSWELVRDAGISLTTPRSTECAF